MTLIESLLLTSGASAVAFAVYAELVNPERIPLRIVMGFFLFGSGLLLLGANVPVVSELGAIMVLVVELGAIAIATEVYNIQLPSQVLDEVFGDNGG